MNGVDREMLAGPTLDAVDLVAIGRVRAGIRTRLSQDELEFVLTGLTGSAVEFRLVACGLGRTPESVRQTYYRRLRRKRTAPS